ncbi:uncharacterized protein [Manis javanica]|uniref:uncharacterized protein n=1 Tax=Manis javanica TaxID=9974 RepID=UPI003C6CEF64
MTQPQVLEEWEASSLSTQDFFPPHLGTARFNKCVEMKRGAVISWDRAEVVEPASKKTRVEEFALPEGAPKTSSPLCAQECRPDSESSLESKAPQGTEQAGSAGEPPAQEEGSRAETPEGLMGLDSGFSSQVFHRVFSCLKRKNEEEGDEEEEEAYVKEVVAYVSEEEPYISEKEPYLEEKEAYVEQEAYEEEEEPYVKEEEAYVEEAVAYVSEEEAYVEEEVYVEEKAYEEEEEPYVSEEEPYLEEDEAYE